MDVRFVRSTTGLSLFSFTEPEPRQLQPLIAVVQIIGKRDQMNSSLHQSQPLLNERPLEDMSFRASSTPTLGVELELQIIDPATADLAPGALRILDVCAEEGLEGVSEEFLLSMLEVKTCVCHSVAEVRDCLVSRLRRVFQVARSLGYELAVGGTHPFTRGLTSSIFPKERYLRIQKQRGWLAYMEAIFGLHIHVGVPDGDKAIGLVNLLVQYLPHLLALSANSPFWEGIDTGYGSARTQMFRPSSHVGIPPHFSCWQEFCHYCEVMYQAGAIQGTKDLYWDVRPRPQMGTIEFRIFDAPPTLSCLLGLTALLRCLVSDGLRILDTHPQLGHGDPRQFWLASENKWLAARYGLQAMCVRQPDHTRTTLANDVGGLLERLLPLAREQGEDSFLDVFRSLDRFETGAQRQRRLRRQWGEWHAVIIDMRDRWLEGLAEAAPSTTAPPERQQSSSSDDVFPQEPSLRLPRRGHLQTSWGKSLPPRRMDGAAEPFSFPRPSFPGLDSR